MHEKVDATSKIVASAYLGKALTFLTKDENQFQAYFDKAILLKPDFYQAYARVSFALTDAFHEKHLEQSLPYYEKCLNLKPNLNDDAFFENYGIALYKLGTFKQDETLFRSSVKQFEKALKIQPEQFNTLCNYGATLSELATIKHDEILFNKAFEQFEKALKIKPDNFNSLSNYGVALSDLAIIKQDEVLLDKAFKQFKKALEIKPNETYNIACYYSVTKNLELCKENPLKAEKNSTLPINPYKQLNEDKDLENARSESWFIELLERLKSKDENLDKVS